MLSICWKNSSGPAAKLFVTAIFHRRNGSRILLEQRHFTPVTRWKPSETSQLDRCCRKVADLRTPHAGKSNLSCVPEPEETFEYSIPCVSRSYAVRDRSGTGSDGYRPPLWNDHGSFRGRNSECHRYRYRHRDRTGCDRENRFFGGLRRQCSSGGEISRRGEAGRV